MRSLAVTISTHRNGNDSDTVIVSREPDAPPSNVLCAITNSQTVISIENVIRFEKQIGASR